MQKYQYITVDSILAKYHRDFRGLDINEGDAIEWIGEALGYIKMTSVSEEAVVFSEVRNYQADIPVGLHYIIQIVKNKNWIKTEDPTCTAQTIVPILEEELSSCESCQATSVVPVDCNGVALGTAQISEYTHTFGLAFPYQTWMNSSYKVKNWFPVRLANNSFFNTLVCRPSEVDNIYASCNYEYTIVENQLRFSFKEGFVAIACLRQKLDTTGYPMIPDDEYAKAAITYYMAWKIKQREAYNHREGAAALAKEAENQWNSYIKKFKNKTKMPFGVDQYQNLMEQSNYLIPNHNRYYGFFGNLGKMENRSFNQRYYYARRQ